MLLSLLLSALFFCLSAIHFNWVFGGQFGFSESLPTNENGQRVLNPKKTDSAIVAFALTAFGLFYVLNAGITNYNLPETLTKYAGWIIPILFFLRAIGDFKYVGFFKTIRRTNFGKLDSKFFSPLCLLIGILGLLIKFIA